MKKWIVRDAVGREYEVTLDAVRRDYADAIKQMDGLTEQEAQDYLDEEAKQKANWQDYWFPEQMADSLATIQSVGRLIKDISDDKKDEIVQAHAKMLGKIEILKEPEE